MFNFPVVSLGLKSLFQSKGVLEPSKAKGDITVSIESSFMLLVLRCKVKKKKHNKAKTTYIMCLKKPAEHWV